MLSTNRKLEKVSDIENKVNDSGETKVGVEPNIGFIWVCFWINTISRSRTVTDPGHI